MRIALLMLAGCGAAGKGTASRACLPVAPMKLLVLEHGNEWEPLVELRADGSIVRERSTTLGKLATDTLSTSDGKPMLRCEDRTIFVDARAMAKFDEQDRFIDSDGSTLFLDASGTVHWMRQGKDILGESRFEGAWSSARRTALVVVIAALAGGRAF